MGSSQWIGTKIALGGSHSLLFRPMNAATIPPSRAGGRLLDEARSVEIIPDWLEPPLGSALIKQGKTWVLATVSLESRVPEWLQGRGRGWLTASYQMLPGSSPYRVPRERKGVKGRTHEIERLIGRSLRAGIKLEDLGEQMLHVDCDVLQADGGTRTASICAAWVALSCALRNMKTQNLIESPVRLEPITALSVGMLNGRAYLDLDYNEDANADVDLNVVMLGAERFIEVQGTAEGRTFDREALNRMLDLAEGGIRKLQSLQLEVIDHG